MTDFKTSIGPNNTNFFGGTHVHTRAKHMTKPADGGTVIVIEIAEEEETPTALEQWREEYDEDNDKADKADAEFTEDFLNDDTQ